MFCPFRHLTASIELIALLATFDASVISFCCASMLDFILVERQAMMVENIGIPASVTKDKLQDV